MKSVKHNKFDPIPPAAAEDYTENIAKLISYADSVIYLNVAQPALYRIGDLRESDEINVSVEHLATAIVGRTISQLSFLYRQSADQSRRVMVSCISGEYYDTMKILAGGQAFKLFPDLPEILGADEYAADFIDAVIAGRRLLELDF